MIVRIKETIYNVRFGMLPKDTQADLDSKLAVELIQNGYAELVTPVIETATSAENRETACINPTKRTRKKVDA